MPACSLCGGDLKRTLVEITAPDRFERHLGIAAEGYSRRWVECGTCGGATNVMSPENAALVATVAENYYAIDFPDTPLRERFEFIMSLPGERSDNAARVSRVLDFVAPRVADRARPHRILDVGAGLGVFLARFLDQAPPGAWRGVAVETDPLASAHLTALARFPVVTQPLPCALPDRGYDVCTLNKVLEHIPQPGPVLAAIREVLSASAGTLYVEVPDKLTIEHRPPSDNILGALHCHLYSEASLEKLIVAAGYRPLEIRSITEASGKYTVYCFATPRA